MGKAEALALAIKELTLQGKSHLTEGLTEANVMTQEEFSNYKMNSIRGNQLNLPDLSDILMNMPTIAPINYEKLAKKQGTAKENFSHRSKFHSKHL